jgi:hypothetical protein
MSQETPPQTPQAVDPRAQAVVNYVLENQEKLCYSPNTTLVIQFHHQQVQAKITFQCEI